MKKLDVNNNNYNIRKHETSALELNQDMVWAHLFNLEPRRGSQGLVTAFQYLLL